MFKMKYTITPMYLPNKTQRRSGYVMSKVVFGVAHDTGNPQSTARGNVTYYTNSVNDMQASAHIFVDDKEIIECVPLLTAPPEKAWHVIYNVTTDNKMFGVDANDSAFGVEYCYGTNINADEAYKRYVWVLAYAFYKLGANPKNLTGHFILDPARKTDPKSGLAKSGRTFEQLQKDVIAEYNDCQKTEVEVIKVEQWKLDTLKKLATYKQKSGEAMVDYDTWKDKLNDPAQVWLMFELMKRILEKVDK